MSWKEPGTPCMAILFMFFSLEVPYKQNSRLTYMKRELDANLYRFNIYLKLNSTRNFPLHIAMQSKNNKRKKMRKTSFY